MANSGKGPDRHSGLTDGRGSLQSPVGSSNGHGAQEIRDSVPAARERHSIALRHHPWLWLLPVVLLLLALGPWPYGYYVLLRLIVCGVCALLAWQQWQIEDGASAWVVTMGGIAVLYNPILPIHLTREIWVMLNLVVAVALVMHLLAIQRRVRRINRELKRSEAPAREIGRNARDKSCNAVTRPESQNYEE